MNIKNKRIIAKEFIYFISCIVITLLTFISIKIYNFSILKAAENIQSEITAKNQKRERLLKKIEHKRENQISYTRAYQKEFGFSDDVITGPEIWQMIYSDVKNDSVEYKMKHIWSKKLLDFDKKFGLQNSKKLSDFILANTVDIDDIKLSDKIKNEIRLLESQMNNKLSKVITSNQQFKMTQNTFYVTILLLFLIRYIFIGTIWSLKILKEKNGNGT